MQLNQLVQYLNQLLDSEKISDYCPNGLQVEGRSDIKKIITGVTASQALLDQAVEENADAILVHHGYFWKGEDACVRGIKQKRLSTLLKNDINLLAYHLPLDVHSEYGNNVQLARVLGLDITEQANHGGVDKLITLGRCQVAMTGNDLLAHIEKQLARTPLYIPGQVKQIERVGWCTGAAQDFIEVAIEQRCDAYITGEVSERTVHYAREAGIHFYAAGHHATERYGVQALGLHVAEQFGLSCKFIDIDNPV